MTKEQALHKIIWKLMRNEIVDNKIVPAKIDRNDIVIRDAIKVIEKGL